jgi:enoyl-CoA hydratase/carnithine racemase
MTAPDAPLTGPDTPLTGPGAPLLLVDHGDWLEARFNRPARLNALTPAMLFELAAAVSPARLGGRQAVVISGAGDKAFSAGFDLDVLREQGAAAHDGDPLGTAVAALLHCPAPVIAVLHGHCLGAAVEIAAACDLRLARADVRIAIPANKVGSLYRPAGIDLVAGRFGWSTAVELLVFGRSLTAQTAVARGIVAQAADADSLPALLTATLAQVLGSSGRAGDHAAFLREWAQAGGLDQDAMRRWETLRAAQVAGRSIPVRGQP